MERARLFNQINQGINQVLFVIAAFATASSLAACSPSRWREVSSKTAAGSGDGIYQNEAGSGAPMDSRAEDGNPTAAGTDGRRFAVLNIATEMLRLYEKCDGSACRGHRLVHEISMLAGPNLAGRRTWLGEYRVHSWHQFYADAAGDYPSFWQPGYPALPRARASLSDWLATSLLPDGKGKQRGNFGWFTAKLAPEADGQWLQGTWGWSEDGDRFIRLAKAAVDDPSRDVQTHGCTRVDNVSIAFLRRMLPVGAIVVRVYAREKLVAPLSAAARSAAAARAPKLPWNLEADALFQEAAQASGAALRGEYQLNQTASAVPLAQGNKYGVAPEKMRGFYLVDQGLFENYDHPEGLDVGGDRNRGAVPDMLVAPALPRPPPPPSARR